MIRSLVGCAVAAAIVVGAWVWRAAAIDGDGRGLLRSDGQVDRTLDCDPCHGFVAWSGTWNVARGGPTVFFLEALGGSSASLTLDGERILDAAPLPYKRDPKPRMSGVRKVIPAGPHAVTITHNGDGTLRVFWLPVGRRGDPEYVPPEALRPVPPERAGAFGDAAWRPEAVAFSVSVLVLGALAIVLLRPRPTRATLLAALAVFAAAAALRLANVTAFGQTWDEDVYWSSGRNYLVNLANLDLRPRNWTFNYEHPPVAKYLLGLGALWHDGYGPARALEALLSSGTCVVALLIGRDLFSLRVGIGAGLLAAFAPHLIAHASISGLETPSTFFVTLAAWLFLRRSFLLAGVAGGLAAGSRFIAALVFFAMAASALASALASLRGGERRMTTVREWLRLALAPVAGFATLVALWPRLWLDGPIAGLRIAYHKLNVQHTPEWFLGVKILTPVPKAYFFAYFAAGMAPAVLLGLLLCVVLVVWRRDRAGLRLLPFVLAPFGMLFSPVIQSGLRYLLPAVPVACVLAAAGLDAAAARVRAWLPAAVHGAAAVACLVSCLLVRPYYLDYYNALWGGPRAAWSARRFVFGWWGEGMQAALDHVNAVAPRGARVYYDLFPNHIAWLRDDFVIVKQLDQADYALFNNFQWRSDAAPTGFHEIFAERVDGAPLAKVFAKD